MSAFPCSVRGQHRFCPGQIILVLFSVLMIFLAYQLVTNQMRVSQSSAAMHIPMWKMYTILLFGFVLMLVRIIQAFFNHKEEQQEVL